mmetsp:Transcript_4805/g.14781  ORF Transcript_4805/g.14781 Transcript_4805/m.14781 type:complete len:244 (+) Transcript_4805:630-1361(+)
MRACAATRRRSRRLYGSAPTPRPRTTTARCRCLKPMHKTLDSDNLDRDRIPMHAMAGLSTSVLACCGGARNDARRHVQLSDWANHPIFFTSVHIISGIAADCDAANRIHSPRRRIATLCTQAPVTTSASMRATAGARDAASRRTSATSASVSASSCAAAEVESVPWFASACWKPVSRCARYAAISRSASALACFSRSCLALRASPTMRCASCSALSSTWMPSPSEAPPAPADPPPNICPVGGG